MRFLFIAFLAFVVSFANMSLAEAAEESMAITDVYGIGDKVDAALAAVKNALSSAGGNILPIGYGLLYAFLGIALPWMGIRWALGSDKAVIIGDSMELILKWGVASWLLHSYAQWGIWISGGFDTIIQAISGNTESGAVQSLISVALSVFTAIWNVLGGASETIGWLGKGLIPFLLLAVAMIVVLFILARAFMTAALFVVAASVFFDIMWMLAPIFIPFILGWIFSPLFQNWVNMVVLAGLYKLLAVVVVVAITAILGATGLDGLKNADVAQSMFIHGDVAKPSINLLAVLVVIFLALVIEYLAKQIPAIASGLVGVRAIDIGAVASGGAMAAGAASAAATSGKGGKAALRAIQAARDRRGAAAAQKAANAAAATSHLNGPPAPSAVQSLNRTP